mgnify:CR=1 FL=1
MRLFTRSLRKRNVAALFAVLVSAAASAQTAAAAKPSGRVAASQSTSRPAAATSLAALRTTAVLDGDKWIAPDETGVFRFDASDLMPGAVGAGTFWTEITKWITGQSTDDTLNNIEKSWPKA